MYINFYFYKGRAAMFGLSVLNIKELRLQNFSIKIGNFLYNLINETYIYHERFYNIKKPVNCRNPI